MTSMQIADREDARNLSACSVCLASFAPRAVCPPGKSPPEWFRNPRRGRPPKGACDGRVAEPPSSEIKTGRVRTTARFSFWRPSNVRGSFFFSVSLSSAGLLCRLKPSSLADEEAEQLVLCRCDISDLVLVPPP